MARLPSSASPVLLCLLCLLLSLLPIRADLPTHCVKWEVLGNWTFKLSGAADDYTSRTCGHTRPDDVVSVLNYSYDAPGFATQRTGVFTLHDSFSSNATLCIADACEDAEWTMVYDEGLAVYGTVTGTELFLEFVYKPRVPGAQASQAVNWDSYCGETYPGWWTSPGRQGCAVARRDEPVAPHASDQAMLEGALLQTNLQVKVRQRLASSLQARARAIVRAAQTDSFGDMAAQVNAQRGRTWTAHADAAAVFEGLSKRQAINMWGGERSKVLLLPKSFSLDSIQDPQARAQEELRRDCVEQVLPASRDWSGSQYSTPVVSQGDCGSCYAVSSVDAMTMRVRIARNDSAMAKFSTQHVLTCSAMNQGCSGGFPWLVGYHASHEGLVSSTCDVDYSDVAEPFVAGPEPRCDDEQKCERTYAVNYGYVGGYYGRGNAADMMWSLERDGPLVVAVNPGPHFQVYRSGLFVASKNTSPRDYVQFVDAYWERTTHAVVLVGYGSMMVDGQLVPTWKVKNSWGETWGDRGYFHIQRGVDAIAVESMPVHVSFSTTPGNPDFETQVRAKLDLPATDPRCRAVIESMLKTGFL